jgi:hypothetical protein
MSRAKGNGSRQETFSFLRVSSVRIPPGSTKVTFTPNGARCFFAMMRHRRHGWHTLRQLCPVDELISGPSRRQRVRSGKSSRQTISVTMWH